MLRGRGREGPLNRSLLAGTQRVGHRDTLRLPNLRQLWGEEGARTRGTNQYLMYPRMGLILSLRVHFAFLLASKQADSQMPSPYHYSPALCAEESLLPAPRCPPRRGHLG